MNSFAKLLIIFNDSQKMIHPSIHSIYLTVYQYQVSHQFVREWEGRVEGSRETNVKQLMCLIPSSINLLSSHSTTSLVLKSLTTNLLETLDDDDVEHGTFPRSQYV